MSQSGRRLVALVPLRHHSQRVPGKNTRIFQGRPLYTYILRTLQACPSLSAIVIDTDSPAIQEAVHAQFPAIQVLVRPEALCGDTVSVTEVLRHAATQVEADWFLQTHSTNPFLRPETVEQAIQTCFTTLPEGFDSLLSVTRWQTRLWTVRGQPMNHDPAVLRQTQDLTPIYVENSCLYLFPASLLRMDGRRVGFCPYFFEIPPLEALDLDAEQDFVLAELAASALWKIPSAVSWNRVAELEQALRGVMTLIAPRMRQTPLMVQARAALTLNALEETDGDDDGGWDE